MTRRSTLGALLASPLLASPLLAARAQEVVDLDVPFVTTPQNVVDAMLDLAGVGPDDRLIDLGSGDGRIVITAARRFGASGLGVEIVPDLVRKSRDAARAALRLVELARGPESLTDSRSMDVQVSRLRKLVEPDPARPRYLQTVWRYGYVFVPDGQPRSR